MGEHFLVIDFGPEQPVKPDASNRMFLARRANRQFIICKRRILEYGFRHRQNGELQIIAAFQNANRFTHGCMGQRTHLF